MQTFISMKRTGVVLFLLMIVSVGCKRENAQIESQSPGTVVFSDAGVSLDVGTGWRRIDMTPGPPVCTPTLVSEAGMVRAMLFARELSDVQSATHNLKATSESSADAVKDSFRQEGFRTDSGLQGVHLSYAARSEKNGKVTEIQSHNYIVKNRAGRCVSISYMVPVEKDSQTVHLMIRRTLKLQ